MLEIEELSKSFGNTLVVDNLSIVIEPNSVVGFLGPNGAGKTTTMRMISGYLYPDSGSVSICGHRISENIVEAHRLLGYLPEAPSGFDQLSVFEFLSFCGQARGFYGSVLQDSLFKISDRLDLTSKLSTPLVELSKGWRQRAWFAQSIMHDPKVIILDEPTDGLDPNQKEIVRELVEELRQDRVVVLSTHILEEVESLCDRVMILCDGKLIADTGIENLSDEFGRLGESFKRLTQEHRDEWL